MGLLEQHFNDHYNFHFVATVKMEVQRCMVSFVYILSIRFDKLTFPLFLGPFVAVLIGWDHRQRRTQRNKTNLE